MKRNLPEKWRRNISLGMTGHKIPESVRRKISGSRKGKKHSPETIEKIKLATKKGAESPNWRGGRTYYRYLITSSLKYKQFRRGIFERDDFTCQQCFKKGFNLNCHHIERFCDNPDRAMDVNNCITLCKKCHVQLHRKAKQKIS